MESKVALGYDAAARAYADRLYRELETKPFDRDMLDRVVAKVGSLGTICDMGCGPGQVSRYLKERGADVRGIDLSAGMISEARRLNPDIQFHQGDMRALTDVTDSTFAAIVAAYAIVNIPPDQLVAVLREFGRILVPGGVLLLSFHVGSEVVHVTDLFGAAVDLDFFFYSVEVIRRLLGAAGFQVDEVFEREPYPEVEAQTHRAYVFAHRSA